MKIKSGIIAIAIAVAMISTLLITFSVAVVGTASADSGYQITIVPSGTPLIVDNNVLVLANGVSKTKIKVYVTNADGIPQNGVSVYLKDVAGHQFTFITGLGGSGYTQTLNVGPHSSSYSETITASLSPDFLSDTTTEDFKFISADLDVSADNRDVRVGDSTTIHISFKDGLIPLANVPILLTIYESNSSQINVPLLTDGSGRSSYS
jgi:hypothetical protein